MIGDKIYYYVGAGLVSLIVIYVLIHLFNLHIRVNKSFMEQFSVVEGFSLPGSEKPGKKSDNQNDGTETTDTLEAQHNDLKAKIKVLAKSLDTIGKDELENYLLDLDEYMDLATVDSAINPKGENSGMLLFSSFYKKSIENAVKYLNSETSQMGNPRSQSAGSSSSGVEVPGSPF